VEVRKALKPPLSVTWRVARFSVPDGKV